jgi:hypothetical protein
MCGLWNIFFQIQQIQAHSVQDNPGYNAMSNCTSNIVIINFDAVYDMSCMIWKCEVHICVRLACMTSKRCLLLTSH